MRVLLLAHRYLGIAVGGLMVMWCVSGMVMMYVPYPRLGETQRLRGLAPISWDRCCAPGPRIASPDETLDEFSIEMRAGGPVLRTRRRLLDLASGAVVAPMSESQAAEVARSFAILVFRPAGEVRPRLLGLLDDDVWTVSGAPAAERPLYRFALGDDSGTELYVSRASGTVVQVTTRWERFWNWLGSIPHWLYFVPLRRHARLWSAVVVGSALLGCLLALTGIAAGLSALRRRQDEWGSPYEGSRRWHHVSGVVFGLFTLTWVASGLLSMNPGGLLEGSDARAERMRVRGDAPSLATAMSAVRALASAPLASGAVAVKSVPVAGRLFFLVMRQDGSRLRLDEQGRAAPLEPGEVARVAIELAYGHRVAGVDLLKAEDAYFIHRDGAPRRLPVYRVVADDEQSTRYYVDALSAEIVAKVDRNARRYRWLHDGLHRLDGWPGLRKRPARDFFMLSLLSGVFMVAVTGSYLAARRLMRLPRGAASARTTVDREAG